MPITQRIAPCLWFDSKKSQRAMKAMLQMKKIELGKIRQAYDGTP